MSDEQIEQELDRIKRLREKGRTKAIADGFTVLDRAEAMTEALIASAKLMEDTFIRSEA